MATLRTLADVEAAGARLPREQGWAPISQRTADYVAALLAPHSVQPLAADVTQAA